MKKTLLNLFTVSAIILFTAATAGAAGNSSKLLQTAKPVVVSDTPYMASVRIYRTGIKDTPYLFFTTSPATVHTEVEQILSGEWGTFKIETGFYSERGLLLRSEIYYTRKGTTWFHSGRQ